MKSKNNKNSLAQGLAIQPSDIVAFVGAGGKTSLMLILAEELFEAGIKIAVTTTTKIGTSELPQNKPSEQVLGTETEELINKTSLIIAQHKIPVLASGVDEINNRLLGIDQRTADLLVQERELDVLLIEADGARRKPFKIPMEHEPVVPKCVTKLCIVVGLDALGLQIDEINFYNVDGMVKLGAVLGEKLTIEMVRRLMYHPDGYLRFKNETREIFLILNKFDLLPESQKSNELAQKLYHNSLSKIIFTSTKNHPTVRSIANNNEHKIGGVILAAGESKRFQGIKQCADIGGESLIYHITTQALNSNLNSITIVLGHEMENVKRSLGNLAESKLLTIIENPDFHDGMSTSLRLGLISLSQKMDALMFILGDQPNISSELLNKLIDAYRDSAASLCIPVVETISGPRQGNPVIIGRKLFDELGEITGDIGAKELVKKYLPYAKLVDVSENSQVQINTQEDLKKYLEGQE